MSKPIMLYFGSFNPVHMGHIRIAQYALAHCPIRSLWYILSPQNPLKNTEALLPAPKRLQLLRLALRYLPHCYVSSIECHLPTPSYTYITLRYLRTRFPRYTFVLLMGSDVYSSFSKWKAYKEIAHTHDIYIYKRKAYPLPQPLPARVFLLDAPLFDISSTEIRRAIALQQPFSHLLPDAVADYIMQHHLYTDLIP